MLSLVLWTLRAAADVEEVSGLPPKCFMMSIVAIASPALVYHAGDVPVEGDVVEPVFAGFDFLRILFVRVSEGFKSGWRKSPLSSNETFASRHVILPSFVRTSGFTSTMEQSFLPEELVEASQESFKLFCLSLSPKPKKNASLLIWKACRPISGSTQSSAACFRGDFFNVHAACYRRYNRDFT